MYADIPADISADKLPIAQTAKAHKHPEACPSYQIGFPSTQPCKYPNNKINPPKSKQMPLAKKKYRLAINKIQTCKELDKVGNASNQGRQTLLWEERTSLYCNLCV